MILSPETLLVKARNDFEALIASLDRAVETRQRIDEVERSLMAELLRMGRTLLELFVAKQGDGDVGPTCTVGDESFARFPQPHERRYVSIFGALSIDRTVYGTRPTQKIEAAPLDARLGLPVGDFSYVLQDWQQRLCVKEAYREAVTDLGEVLGIAPSVRSAEAMNQAMAEHAEYFRAEQPAPPADQEGELLVVTADGKGVPMRGPDRSTAHSADKPGVKRMAYVGAVYSIDRFVRTADDVLDELRRRQRSADRPTPMFKRVRAEMTRLVEGEDVNGRTVVFGQLQEELERRNPGSRKPVVCLLDGERALWDMKQALLSDAVGVLDLFHASERLWDAAKVFHAVGSKAAERFVDDRLRLLLEGKVGYVIGGLRQMAVKHKLRGRPLRALQTVITYYENNRAQMRYDEYLAAGYPIGSGVAEGACRHLVKDRMEGTGMRWRTNSAQAMLHLRAIYLNGDWRAFQDSRIAHEQTTLYAKLAL